MKGAELQIGLGWSPVQNGFDVSIHASTDDEITYIQLPHDPLKLDPTSLGVLLADTPAYAESLTTQLFAVTGLRDQFVQMLALAEENDSPLHLRLLVDRTAPPVFHTLRWELLCDPRTGQSLALNRLVTLTRFVNPRTQSTVSLRGQSDLRALVVAADPEPLSLANYGLPGNPLAPIDAQDEATRARSALRPIPTTVVCTRGQSTLRNIAALLTQAENDARPYSIVYLIAHGALHEQGPVLYLETDQGRVAPVSGAAFVQAITELHHRPSLVILAACESASSAPGTTNNLGESATALGPMLVAEGVSSVVAMHGKAEVDTVRGFVLPFLTQLQSSGSLFDALLDGRRAVRDHADWFAPVLFTRLRTGRMWYSPVQVGSGWASTKRTIISSMVNDECTPVVGPALSAGFFPPRASVAAGLARRLQVPITPGSSNDLARISQYLAATHKDRRYPRSSMVAYLSELIEEDGGLTPEELRSAEASARGRQGGAWLHELILALGRRHRAEHDDDPYAILAALPYPVYFTTSYTSLLEDALEAAGRPPTIVDFDPTNRAKASDKAKPSRDTPTVVRLFGGFRSPDSLVLTEDDYFSYLTDWATKRNSSLKGLQSRLTNNNLLLLGFGLDDWDFRIVFRSILCMEGATRLNDLAHVAVQVNPESEMIEADAVPEYLEQYYAREANLSVRWATPTDLLEELRDAWSASSPPR